MVFLFSKFNRNRAAGIAINSSSCLTVDGFLQNLFKWSARQLPWLVKASTVLQLDICQLYGKLLTI